MSAEKVREEAREIIKKYEVNVEVLGKGYFETKLSKIEAKKSFWVKNKEGELIKPVLEALFLNQGGSLKELITALASRLNTPTRAIESLVRQLYRRGFLMISRDRYALTFEGTLYLLNLLDADLKNVVTKKGLRGGCRDE